MAAARLLRRPALLVTLLLALVALVVAHGGHDHAHDHDGHDHDHSDDFGDEDGGDYYGGDEGGEGEDGGDYYPDEGGLDDAAAGWPGGGEEGFGDGGDFDDLAGMMGGGMPGGMDGSPGGMDMGGFGDDMGGFGGFGEDEDGGMGGDDGYGDGDGRRGPAGSPLPIALDCDAQPTPSMQKSQELDDELARLGVTPAVFSAFWRVQDILTDHMGQVFGEGAPLDPSSDVAGALLYDAILLDTSEHLAASAAAAGAAAADAPPLHAPAFKKTTRRLLKRLRRFNTSDSYAGKPVRQGSAQMAALEFLRTLRMLARAMHGRLRGIDGLTVAPDGGWAVRGLACLFLASGRTPYEGAWEAPGATACMVAQADEPSELATIGAVFCNSALAAEAQITATLDRVATGGPDLDALMVPEMRKAAEAAAAAKRAAAAEADPDDAQEAAATPAPQPPAGLSAALEESALRLLHELDVGTFGEDGTPYNASTAAEAAVAASDSAASAGAAAGGDGAAADAETASEL